jgi:excisionase family DNA binding protein
VSGRPETLEELAARVGLEPRLTIDELARLAKVSRRTIERVIAEGRLRVVHLSPRAVRIPRSSAADYLDGLDVDPGVETGVERASIHDLTHPKEATRDR